jgi:hypothetical protein
LHQHIPIVPARSALGKAMNYAHKQWPKLVVYLEDGRLCMDNNLVENAIRPFVIGRKNFLFCDTVAGAGRRRQCREGIMKKFVSKENLPLMQRLRHSSRPHRLMLSTERTSMQVL